MTLNIAVRPRARHSSIAGPEVTNGLQVVILIESRSDSRMRVAVRKGAGPADAVETGRGCPEVYRGIDASDFVEPYITERCEWSVGYLFEIGLA